MFVHVYVCMCKFTVFSSKMSCWTVLELLCLNETASMSLRVPGSDVAAAWLLTGSRLPAWRCGQPRGEYDHPCPQGAPVQ